MPPKNYTWECECGHSMNREKVPAECPKCLNISSFEKKDLEIEEEEDED